MGSSKISASSSLAFFLSLNLFLFSYTDACNTCGSTGSSGGGSSGSSGGSGRGGGSAGSGGGSTGSSGGSSTGGSGSGGGAAKCPRDALKLGVCANVLSGLLGLTVGTPPVTPCCTLIQGLADTEAAICLCTALKANVLGLNLNVPLSLNLLLNACSKNAPSGFKC